MLEKEYEKLVHYLEGMIRDGVQLVHGGHLLDWEDTNITEVLAKIKSLKSTITEQKFESGQLVKNKHTGQKAGIIYSDENYVYLSPAQNVITYPIEKFWDHHEKSKPGE